MREGAEGEVEARALSASEEFRLQAAFEDGVESLAAAVFEAAGSKLDGAARLSAGLRAGLGFLAADPLRARLLFVDALDPACPIRLEYERSLERLGKALSATAGEDGDGAIDAELARLLAGGLASYIAGRILAGEVERLPDHHNVLLEYLLAPSQATSHRE